MTGNIEDRNDVSLINLTGNDIRILNNKQINTIPSTGKATVEIGNIPEEKINQFSLTVFSFEKINDLPEPEANTFYIVTLPVAEILAARIPPRTDVFSPDYTQEGTKTDKRTGLKYTHRFIVYA